VGAGDQSAPSPTCAHARRVFGAWQWMQQSPGAKTTRRSTHLLPQRCCLKYTTREFPVEFADGCIIRDGRTDSRSRSQTLRQPPHCETAGDGSGAQPEDSPTSFMVASPPSANSSTPTPASSGKIRSVEHAAVVGENFSNRCAIHKDVQANHPIDRRDFSHVHAEKVNR